MPLQPGPFRQLSPADVGATPGVYDFTDDALTLEASLNAIASGWDTTLLDIEGFAAVAPDIAIGVDLPGIVNDLDFVSGHLPLSYMGDILDGFTASQTMLDAATAFAPAQAWSDPGAPFEPPDSALTLVVPTVNPEAFVPSVNFTVGGGALAGDRQVSLFNRTRVGAVNFVEGDEFQLLAIGKPGDEVTASGTLNGQDLGTTDYGQIDSSGQMIITGIMGPEVVGVWSQQWSVGGVLLADFNFVVAPAES